MGNTGERGTLDAETVIAIALPFRAMKTSLIGLPFVWALVAVTAALVGAAILVPGAVRKAMVAALALVLGTVTTAAWVNRHYAYLPNVGAVLGQRAVDQTSSANVTRLASRAAAIAPTSLSLKHGLVELAKVPAPVSHFAARPAQVYLPPAWFRSPRPRLPVIELLHGTPGTPEDWTRAGRADVTADRWAARHDGVAPIIVMPDPNGSFTADTECVDGRRGRAETFLAVDVPNWVITVFGAASDSRSWVIAGSSEGGFCALDIALHHPDRYSTFLDFSGLDRPTYPGGATRLLGSSHAVLEHTAEWYLHQSPTFAPEAGWFEVGSADGDNTRSARRVAALATARGIDTHVVVIPHGTHSWRVWGRAFADAFPWAAYRVGLSPRLEDRPTSSARQTRDTPRRHLKTPT